VPNEIVGTICSPVNGKFAKVIIGLEVQDGSDANLPEGINVITGLWIGTDK
jgi:hypothetical protein